MLKLRPLVMVGTENLLQNDFFQTENFDNVFPKLAEILNTKCSSVDQRYLQKLMRDDEIICHLRKQLKCEDSISEVADNLKRILEFIVEKAPFVLMDHESWFLSIYANHCGNYRMTEKFSLRNALIFELETCRESTIRVN